MKAFLRFVISISLTIDARITHILVAHIGELTLNINISSSRLKA